MERRATKPDRRTRDNPDETGEAAELALVRSFGLADPEQWPPANTVAEDIPVFNDVDVVNDRPEALEEHEAADYRAEDDLDWPIITSDPKWLLDHGESRETSPGGSAPGGWLDRAKRAHGVVEPGDYDVAILPRGIRPVSTAKTDGVSFLVGIVGGNRDGVECRLNFLTDGPVNLQRIIRRDLLILERWAHMLGVGVTANVVELIKELGRNGEGRMVTLGLGRRETPNGGVDIFATSVAVGGLRDG